ncbi:bifunctional DNA-formamidopyrimidine glycosylase/DNA-(apurinic or apyrimidinic site) lyase [Corynebacterium epidermidicanis]|uniref:Formamidopyrimidine-DNA glycosylase n=1 Tax=Corynebacterium epidermidicanis TaxID=1050174 RepID=A0A0G3GQN5_9CORY|nr:bifunctional DNA-formamidopyrimidine glycosylase/DNA-(apurinic or apyrimidinic site) lyase [Corynebacterium epidermidicanis]AKK03449.1 DNA-(apurinic or apyrimidinic site) lyase [Corynebacterium epidermidicanis]
MPELPEVEVVRRGLESHLIGRRIVRAEVIHPRVARRQAGGATEQVSRLSGQLIDAVRRRGKYLWLELSDDQFLLIHLGMSGQMLIKDPGVRMHKHLRARLFLDTGSEAWFVDQRTFGAWEFGTLNSDNIPPSIAHIARDVFDPIFDDEAVAAQTVAKRSDIKRVLLDQTVLSGVGNIYADEMLWAAQIHPRTPACELSLSQVRMLIDAGREVMGAALELGGTSFDALYVNVNGESGYFSRSLHAYGQVGQPCFACGTLIIREKFMNRSSYYCPKCQVLG